jgi:hypothetical protein
MQQIIKCSKVDVEKIRQIVQITCITEFNNDVTPREIDILCEYFLHDRSEDAKRSFVLNTGTSNANFHQTSKRLAEKGILIAIQNRDIGKELHPTLKTLKKLYIEENHAYLIVQVN